MQITTLDQVREHEGQPLYFVVANDDAKIDEVNSMVIGEIKTLSNAEGDQRIIILNDDGTKAVATRDFSLIDDDEYKGPGVIFNTELEAQDYLDSKTGYFIDSYDIFMTERDLKHWEQF